MKVSKKCRNNNNNNSDNPLASRRTDEAKNRVALIWVFFMQEI